MLLNVVGDQLRDGDAESLGRNADAHAIKIKGEAEALAIREREQSGASLV